MSLRLLVEVSIALQPLGVPFGCCTAPDSDGCCEDRTDQHFLWQVELLLLPQENKIVGDGDAKELKCFHNWCC